MLRKNIKIFMTIAVVSAISLLTVICPTLASELTGLDPLQIKHAKLLDGRKLFIRNDGAVYVRIDPADPVRLTTDLITVTFSSIQSGQEALEISQLLYAGAIVESENAFNQIVDLLGSYGLKRKPMRDDVDTFVVKKGRVFGENVTEEDSYFRVTYTALVSNLYRMGQGLRISQFDFTFPKNGGPSWYKEFTLLDGLALDWQTSVGSSPARVPMAKREEIGQKALRLCGKALPAGRQKMQVGRLNY